MCIKVGSKKYPILWCTVGKTSNKKVSLFPFCITNQAKKKIKGVCGTGGVLQFHALWTSVLRSDESGGNDLHSSSSTVRIIKSRRIRWERHVARKGERTGVCRVMLAKRVCEYVRVTQNSARHEAIILCQYTERFQKQDVETIFVLRERESRRAVRSTKNSEVIFLYCCTVHLLDSLISHNQQMH